MKKLMFVAAIALSMSAFAQEPMPPMDREPMAVRGGAPTDPIVHIVMNPRVAEKIGLSDEQKAKLKELQPKRGENKALNEKIAAGMKRQMELLNADQIDEAAVMAAIDEVFEAKKEIAKAQTKRLIAVKAVLTPEQIKAAHEAIREMRPQQRRQAPRGKGPHAPEAHQ